MPLPPAVNPFRVSALLFQIIHCLLIRQIGDHQSGGQAQLLCHTLHAAVLFKQFGHLPAPLRGPQSSGNQDLPDFCRAQLNPMHIPQFPPESFQGCVQGLLSRHPTFPARSAVLFPVIIGIMIERTDQMNKIPAGIPSVIILRGISFGNR